MRKILQIIGLLCLDFSLVMLSCSCTSLVQVAPSARATPDAAKEILTTAALPTGGTFLFHPKSKNVRFYFVSKWAMWSDKANVQKNEGLFISEDGGQTWKLRCGRFSFRGLFVHPQTECLYAILNYEWLKTDETGFLQSCFATKAAMSEDGGHQWKDITRENGYICDLTGIMVDPDNPNRVCFKANMIRNYVLQATDDKYSAWTWYREWDWPYRKKEKASQQEK